MTRRSLPTTHTEEARRLAALRRLNVLDTEGGPRFDAITQAASLAFGAPAAFISLVDADRLYFLSSAFLSNGGIDIRTERRDISFCERAIAGREPLVILNPSADPQFMDNPMVSGAPYIRFYAGAPLILPGGEAVGTLCVLDFEPRFRFTDTERDVLTFLAGVATERLAEQARRD